MDAVECVRVSSRYANVCSEEKCGVDGGDNLGIERLCDRWREVTGPVVSKDLQTA